MLIVNNGAPKSGSTWLNSILFHLVHYRQPSREWWPEGWSGPSVAREKLSTFLDQYDWRTGITIFKSHYSDDGAARVLRRPGIVVFDCTRYLPDTVVSIYHHELRNGSTMLTLPRWVETRGIDFAVSIVHYHKRWAAGARIVSYEHMTSDPLSNIVRIAAALGFKLPPEGAASIAADATPTSIDRWTRGRMQNGCVGVSANELPAHLFTALDALDDYTDRQLIPAQAPHVETKRPVAITPA